MEKSRNPITALPTPHPLKEVITKNRIPLWQVVRLAGLDRSECWLSRALNGITPMDPGYEKKIADALGQVGGAS